MKSKVEVRLPEERRDPLVVRDGDIVLIENLSLTKYPCLARVVELKEAEDKMLLVRLDISRTYELKGDDIRAVNRIEKENKEDKGIEVVEGNRLYLLTGEEYETVSGFDISIIGICDINIDVTNIRR